jgi:Fe-S cluster assembly protein SufD
MNMQTKPPLTVAEQALLDAFGERIGVLPGDAAVTDTRDRLLETLKTGGLPTRRVESWHYTDLRSLLRVVPPTDAQAGATAREAFVAGATVLHLIDGVAHGADRLPDGLSLDFHRDVLRSGGAEKRMAPRGDDDAIAAINGAFVTDGFVAHVADGAQLTAPVEFQVVHGGGQFHTRMPVTIGANASATIIERHEGAENGSPALVSAVTDLVVDDEANVTWVILQMQGTADTHLGQINVRLGENARLTLYVVNAGGKLVRQEIHVVTEGEGADLQLRGINLLGGDSHTDVTLTLGHDVPNTTSVETVRNVLFDRARGVFQGQIRVAPEAQKTDARMACNTLLLSDEADFSTKPELEIFADDVQCAHGATVADIHDDHLFYLMARGITEKNARGLLVQAFVAEIVEELDDEALVEALENVIVRWLETHA